MAHDHAHHTDNRRKLVLVIAIVAHFLVWQWRPWLPGPRGYVQSMIDGATSLATYLT